MKKKTFIVQLLDSKKPNRKSFTQVEDANFYSNDTDASLVFIPHEDTFDFQTAKVVMYNRSDESLVERDAVVTTENGRKVASYELPEEIILHWGEWVAQPVFISGGEIYSGTIVPFSVIRYLMDNRPPTLRDVIKVDELYSQLVTVMDEISDKDVISAPEIILARGGENTLGERLDKEHNEVTAQLAQKASKKELQSVADGSPKGTFATVSELENAFPTGDDGNYLLQSDGHIYHWSGTEWSDTGILYQAAGIADNSVDFTKTNFLDHGENKANPYTYTDGWSVNAVGGLSVDADYSASDFIPVKSGVTYVIYPNDTTIKRPTFFDDSKEFIENMMSYTSTNPVTYTPATDGYIRLGVLTTGKMNVSVTDQSYSKEFVPFYIKGVDNLRTKPLRQSVGSEELQDKTVTPEKTDFLEYGENKANPYIYTDGYSINASGDLSVDADYSASDFIPVKSGITYVIYPHNTTMKRPTFFNDSKEFIENVFSSTTSEPLTYTPSTDGYIRIGVLTTGKTNVSVTDQNYSKEFVPFYIKGADNLRTRPLRQSVGSEELQDKTVTADKTTFFDDGHNLFEEDSPIDDSFRNLLGPDYIQTSTDYVLYDNVPVMGGETLHYRAFGMGGGIRFVLYFDNEDSFIDGVEIERPGARTYELSVPTNATRASITVFKENTSHILSRHTDIAEGQSNYQIKPFHIANMIPPVDPLANKRLLGFGDSIGQGGGNVVNGSGYGYIEMVADDNQMTHENYSIGGATIAPREGSDNQIINQIRLAISNGDVGDYIVFNGLTNDANVTPIDRIGEMTVGYTDELDLNTFAGSFEEVCRTLKLNWLEAKIIYVRVHNMSSRGTQQVLYGEMATKICKKYSIPIVDMYSEGGLNTQIIEMTNLYTNNADSTHPNALGYRTFYVPKIEAKMKSL